MSTIRKFALSIAIMLSASSLSAQTAREVLDATAARFNTSGVKATFKATSYDHTTPSGETTGTMMMKGSKFKLTSTEMSAWFDGTTQWTMLQGSDEVNVTTPTAEEQAAVNPAVLLQVYKQGYRMSLSRSTLRGKPTYVVRLTAQHPTADTFSTILLDIEQETHTPYCIRAKQGDNWVRLVIHNFQTSQSFSDSTFTFPASSYPDVEVIDLR